VECDYPYWKKNNWLGRIYSQEGESHQGMPTLYIKKLSNLLYIKNGKIKDTIQIM